RPVAGTGPGRAPVRRRRAQSPCRRPWYGDGPEIATGEGKLQLASVLDMGSRRIVGFALGEHHDAELAYGALAMAVAVRGGQGVRGRCGVGARRAGARRNHAPRSGPPSTPRAGSGEPAPGCPSPSRWAGPG